MHISSVVLAGGKRIDRVEDVLTLGQSVEVRVDDIDPQGKVSLSLAVGARRLLPRRPGRRGSSDPGALVGDRRPGDGVPVPAAVSFEEAFEAELVATWATSVPGRKRAAAAMAARGGNDRGRQRPSSGGRGRSRTPLSGTHRR